MVRDAVPRAPVWGLFSLFFPVNSRIQAALGRFYALNPAEICQFREKCALLKTGKSRPKNREIAHREQRIWRASTNSTLR